MTSIDAALGAQDLEATISPQWEAAQAVRPAGELPFLDPALIRARRVVLGLSAECDPPLLAVAHEVRNDLALAAIAWYLHWRIFVGPKCELLEAPPLELRLGRRTGAFFLLIALEFGPALSALNHARGYPDDITTQCLRAISDYIDTHQRAMGSIGCFGHQVCWLRTYFDFPYVRLGRFAYQLMPFSAPVEAWRRRGDGTVVALARDGLGIAGDGLLARAAPDWTARLKRTVASVEGHPINPIGIVEKRRVCLDRATWAPILCAGDPVLSIHIPPGGDMDLQSVQESFRQALAFFSHHHPATPARAFCCTTWFLDPQLANILPLNANVLRFQRCLYLHPREPWADGGLWFVFRCPTHDPSVLPRDTSLQRALADFLVAGGRWSGGGGFLPAEDADNLIEGKWRDAFVTCFQ